MTLEIDALSLGFSRPEGLWRQRIDWQLHEVSLRVAPGQVVALIGASGVGKTLLAHAVTGALPANAVQRGTIRPPARIGYLPQQNSWLDPTARIGDQIAWAARRAARPACIAQRLARFGLSADLARHYPHQLSGGMARRVLMAMALIAQPALLVADEPTSGLDPACARILLAAIRAHADAGGAVLMITHDLAGALPCADQVGLLDQGRLGSLCRAADFAGDGARLDPPARRQWQALPQNRFADA